MRIAPFVVSSLAYKNVHHAHANFDKLHNVTLSVSNHFISVALMLNYAVIIERHSRFINDAVFLSVCKEVVYIIRHRLQVHQLALHHKIDNLVDVSLSILAEATLVFLVYFAVSVFSKIAVFEAPSPIYEEF